MLMDSAGLACKQEGQAVAWHDWQSARAELIAKNAAVILTFPNDEDIRQLKADSNHFSEIILTFPAFKDGRAYSQARILREELGFKGALRARGEVLIDQVFFMRRCGFDRFEVADDIDKAAWQKALTGFSLAYQPSNDSMKTIWQRRHGR